VKTACLAVSLLRRLLAWSRRRRLILLYNLYPAPAAISLFAARLTGARVVAIVADLHVPGAGTRPAGVMNRIDFALQTWAMPRLDGLIVLTRQMATDFAGDAPVLHMEGGVEDSGAAGFKPAEMRRRAEGPPLHSIMYSGGLSEFRGVSLLLDAFKRLRGDYQLWITGRGELERDVERAAAADPRITYFGVVERERLRELHARAAVLVNPLVTRYASSRYIFPSKLLEYMATGTPVLTTMPPDVAAEYAQYVYGFNETPEELAAAIERVLALPAEDRDAFGARARAFVLEKKNWRIQGERVTKFIAEVMGR
jgi:glycosyltransferase involved in cell wall biosynthesis